MLEGSPRVRQLRFLDWALWLKRSFDCWCSPGQSIKTRSMTRQSKTKLRRRRRRWLGNVSQSRALSRAVARKRCTSDDTSTVLKSWTPAELSCASGNRLSTQKPAGATRMRTLGESVSISPGEPDLDFDSRSFKNAAFLKPFHFFCDFIKATRAFACSAVIPFSS